MTIRNMILMAAAVAVMPLAAQADDKDASGEAGPRIELESKTLDLGLMQPDEEKTDTVTFRNTGTEPLLITSVRSNCGCTAATVQQGEIAPGQSGQIVVKFNSRGRLPGAFRKLLRIRSNAVNKLEVLFVEGKVARDYIKR